MSTTDLSTKEIIDELTVLMVGAAPVSPDVASLLLSAKNRLIALDKMCVEVFVHLSGITRCGCETKFCVDCFKDEKRNELIKQCETLLKK